MTALYPYGRVRLGNRMDAWTLGGVGWGELTIKEDGGQPLETDLGMTMGGSEWKARSRRRRTET